MVESPKSEDQPRAKQIAHAPQPAVWSADKERQPLPFSGDLEGPRKRLHEALSRAVLHGRGSGYAGCKPPKCGVIMSRVIAVMACGFTVAACSASVPSLNFLNSSPPTAAVRFESEPAGAEVKTS
jgi:hypothetical protein